MFEDSLYNQEPAEPVKEGEFLYNYELKTWDITPRIYKIIGASVIVNILVILIAGQGSLLTAKTCDSPLVGRVCQVLDTVYVGSLLFGTQREYVDAAYDKTDLGDADITFVDVSGATPPLEYPAGYFQLANPEQFAIQQQMAANPTLGIPGIPNPATPGGLISSTPNLPKYNPNVVDESKLPTFNSEDDPPIATMRKNRRGGRINATPDDSTTASTNTNTNTTTNPTVGSKDPKVDPTDPISGVELNKRPFVDLANNVNDLLDKNQVKLETAFVVNANGKLTKDGKLDPKSFRYLQVASTDQKMIDVVKEAIEAINDSGYLQYLKDLSGKDFSLLLQQDDLNISAVVQSEMESDKRANSIKSALTLLIDIAKSRKTAQNADQNDKDDLVLLENAKVETDGKKVVIKFTVPKEIALPMIQRKLAEQKAQPRQPNGAAKAKPNDNTAK